MALHGFTRILGITLLLATICIFTPIIEPVFADTQNLSNLLRWTALFGILALGVAFVIITGGIDLSIGSVVALTGITLMSLLQVTYTDSGRTVTIVDRTREGNTRIVQLAEPPPSFNHLDQLRTPNPRGGYIELTIDAQATAALGRPRAVVVGGQIDAVPPGASASLRTKSHMNPLLAVGITLLVGIGIGLVHGILIGYGNLQPFIVTLCGLMAYRGVARLISKDQGLGIGMHHQDLRYLATGQPMQIPVPGIEWISKGKWSSSVTGSAGVESSLPFWSWVPLPMPMLILLVLAIAGAIFLHKTVWGRYLLAMGRNSEAARFSGINTKRMTVLAYVLCSGLASLGGVLFALDLSSVQPSSHGNFYELYAIAAAVLGGCSLRGGVGSIAGVIIGTAVMRSLYNVIDLLEKPTYWEYIIIGSVLLLGVMIDEIGRVAIEHYKTRKRRESLET